MKKALLIVAVLFMITSINAQKIELKKGKLLLDGTQIMTFDREDWGMQKIHLYDIVDGKEQILMIKNNNETREYNDDDFLQIKFIQLGVTVEMKSHKSWKGQIAWLIKTSVLSKEGKVNEEEVPLFQKNYDENFTDRTIRY